MSYHVFLFHLVNDSLKTKSSAFSMKQAIIFVKILIFSWIWTHFDTGELDIYFLFFNRNVMITFVSWNRTSVNPTGSSSFHRSALSPPSLSLHVSFFFSFSLSRSLSLALYRVTRCVAAHAIFAVGRGLFHHADPYSALSSSSRIHRSQTGG